MRTKLLTIVIFLVFSQLVINQNSYCQESENYSNLPEIFLQKISLKMQNVSFETFLDTFSQKTKIKLNYNRSRIPLSKSVTVNLKNKQAIDVLNMVLNQTKTELKFAAGEQYLIVPRINKYELMGKISGKIVDIDNQRPLIGANILLEEYQMGDATNVDGEFTIDNIPVGNYTLKISYIGYQSIIIPDIIIKSNRTTFVNEELKETPVVGEPVIVRDNYFSDVNAQPVSSSSFSSEEIRRTATFVGDVSRIVSVLPGTSLENEGNNLIVRGGSTIENKFYIDNIEVPNINHLPIFGTTGGFYSVVNIDFIKNVDFFSGGFNSKYGNALSSIMSINLREGNREENDYQLDLNIAGMSAQGEGPINNGKGSWMVSARHNFSDIMLKLQNEKEQKTIFNDVQGKLVYNLSSNHELSFVDIFSTDEFSSTRNYAFSNYTNWYGYFKAIENVFGMNWKYLWSEDGYSNTTLSHIYRKDNVSLFTTLTKAEKMRIRSSENYLQIRNDNFYRFNTANRVEFGMDLKLDFNNLNNFYNSGFDLFGNTKPELEIIKTISTLRTGGFLNYEWIPIKSLSFMPGIRFDFYNYNKSFNISPRLSIIYRLSQATSITGSAGLYYQNLPLYLISQNEKFKKLKDPLAYHMILSFNHLFSDDLKLTIELYDKEYKHTPIDPNLYSLYLLDEAITQLYYDNHETLVSTGSASARGIEVMIQKKLSVDFYGTISASLFSDRYKDLNGIWRNRIIDSNFMFAFEAGYKPSNEWEFSMKFYYSNGLLYTPFDKNKSIEMQSGILEIDKINSLQFQDFNVLSLRVDRRFHFTNSNLIIYLSVWNTFDRKNTAWHAWSEVSNFEVHYNQFSIAPIFGVEFDF